MTRPVVESLSNPTIALLPAEQGLADEMAMLKAVAQGRRSRASLIWSTQECLVVPRFMETMAGFSHARGSMAREGWPIHVRFTGGDVYPQGAGIVNIAIAFRLKRGDFDRVGGAYAALCDPIVDAMRDLGIDAQCGSIDGAFCRGSHDIAIGGRKIAGVAQRWRAAAPPFESFDLLNSFPMTKMARSSRQSKISCQPHAQNPRPRISLVTACPTGTRCSNSSAKAA